MNYSTLKKYTFTFSEQTFNSKYFSKEKFSLWTKFVY